MILGFVLTVLFHFEKLEEIIGEFAHFQPASAPVNYPLASRIAVENRGGEIHATHSNNFDTGGCDVSGFASIETKEVIYFDVVLIYPQK